MLFTMAGHFPSYSTLSPVHMKAKRNFRLPPFKHLSAISKIRTAEQRVTSGKLSLKAFIHHLSRLALQCGNLESLPLLTEKSSTFSGLRLTSQHLQLFVPLGLSYKVLAQVQTTLYSVLLLLVDSYQFLALNR